MPDHSTEPAVVTDNVKLETSEPVSTSDSSHDAQLVESDLLVEDISIDGMCGVY